MKNDTWSFEIDNTLLKQKKLSFFARVYSSMFCNFSLFSMGFLLKWCCVVLSEVPLNEHFWGQSEKRLIVSNFGNIITKTDIVKR